MSMTKNKQVLLAARPKGWVQESDFKIAETDLPALQHGEVLVQNHFLSLDPYMRGRMDDAKSYAASVNIGAVMTGGTVGEVVESKNPKFAKGDHVLAMFGWQQYGISDGRALQKIDDRKLPMSVFLGCLGMPGVTAWYGLTQIGAPKAGETVVVSAASGAVGSVVGQLAKILGCRAVGVAGGKAKCDYVVKELGLDACVDYKAGNLAADLKAAAPQGIDVYFDNVGGEVLDTVLKQLNAFARIPLCGLIAGYNAAEAYPLRNYRSLLVNRVLLQGFIVSEHMEFWPQALKELGELVGTGRIKYRESIAQGLEDAPKAFIGMLKGENFGKQLVKLV
jgi:NADPH-dependent curcumin reductase CurA